MSEHVNVPPAPRPRLVLAGALAAVAGIAVSLLVTNLLNARATPVEVVAEVVIEKTPGSISEPLIHLVGTYDKPLLIGGVTLAIVLLGAVAGLLTARRTLFGHLVFWAMAAVALVAAMTPAANGSTE